MMVIKWVVLVFYIQYGNTRTNDDEICAILFVVF